MFFVYIIYSESIQQFYCGQTHNIIFRLQQHNSGETVSNKHGIPWMLIGYLKFETRSEAMIVPLQRNFFDLIANCRLLTHFLLAYVYFSYIVGLLILCFKIGSHIDVGNNTYCYKLNAAQ